MEKMARVNISIINFWVKFPLFFIRKSSKIKFYLSYHEIAIITMSKPENNFFRF